MKSDRASMDGILKKGSNNLFYSFSNVDGKRWIMPSRKMSTAMNLYQPSHWKGKLVKQFFPHLIRFGFMCKILFADKYNYELEDDLKQLLCSLFKTKDIEFSVFCGTPSVFQKTTIQISKGTKILGYCKVTKNEDVKDVFRHEKQVLEYLKHQSIQQIPECLFSGALNVNTALFVQTTVKTNSSKVKHKWSNLHTNFLIELHRKTKIKLSFAETDFAKSLCILEEFLPSMPDGDADVIGSAILNIRNHFREGSGVVEFSVFHGDFTPWNMFFEKEEIFVFDFEYAKLTYPPYLDFFHFITQVGIIEKNSSYDQIYNYCKNQADQINVLKQNFSVMYLSYLLSIISFYFKINKKVLDKDDRCYRCWLPLIDFIEKKVN